MSEFGTLTTSAKCTAHSARTGLPCQKYAIKGATVCRTHGGAAPQVKAKAEQRLREMVSPMLDKLYTLAMQTDNLKVASECVRDALDRAGVGAVVEAKVRQSHKQEHTGSGITVNIGFLSDGRPMDRPTLEAAVLPVVTGSVLPVVMGQLAPAALASAEPEG